MSREEELRRERAREREERDKMVRDYIRFAFHEDNGRDDDKEEEEDDNHRHIDHDEPSLADYLYRFVHFNDHSKQFISL